MITEDRYLNSTSTSAGLPSHSFGHGADLLHLDEAEHISLCEALDRVLNKGAAVVGELTISVADIDLIYLGLQVILTSIETARETMTVKGDEAYGVDR